MHNLRGSERNLKSVEFRSVRNISRPFTILRTDLSFREIVTPPPPPEILGAYVRGRGKCDKIRADVFYTVKKRSNGV